MKKIITILTLTISCIQLNAQYIQRSVIGSAGNVSTASGITLSSTVGEAITSTLSTVNLRITQGFQQGRRIDSTILYLSIILEGYYAGSYLMEPTLYNQGQSANTSITDSITIELHPASNPAIVSAQNKAILYKNSNVQTTMHVSNGSYYVVVKHRNHIETWSANPISFNGTFAAHDFTFAATQAYGSNLTQVEPGVFAIYSGDVNQDENIDLLDLGIVEADIVNFNFGYLTTDINGDGNVDLLDAPTVENNINNFIFSAHP
jgi:hypothetical protein